MIVAPPAKLDARTLRDTPSTTSPWTSEQLTRLVVMNAVGLSVILVGAFETTGDDVLRTRLSWLQVSVLGLVVAATANALWLLRVRTTLALAREVVLDPAHRSWAAAPVLAVVSGAPASFVTGTGMTRYHLPACALVEGRATTAGTRAEHERAHRSPCEVCTP